MVIFEVPTHCNYELIIEKGPNCPLKTTHFKIKTNLNGIQINHNIYKYYSSKCIINTLDYRTKQPIVAFYPTQTSIDGDEQLVHIPNEWNITVEFFEEHKICSKCKYNYVIPDENKYNICNSCYSIEINKYKKDLSNIDNSILLSIYEEKKLQKSKLKPRFVKIGESIPINIIISCYDSFETRKLITTELLKKYHKYISSNVLK